MMIELSKSRKPFVDATKLKICDPSDPTEVEVDPEKNGVYFADPWNNPYLYFYNSASTVGSLDATWRAPGFILLSKGPDGKAQNSQSMYSTGIIPDMDAYNSDDANVDNILRGRE